MTPEEKRHGPVPEQSGAAVTVVDGRNTAAAVGSGSLAVFSTPMMIALMEQAACAALDGSLAEGQTSVGIALSVAHTAASPIGAVITATATVTEVDGKTVAFQISARDEKREIGSGTHTRALVGIERFMQRVGE